MGKMTAAACKRLILRYIEGWRGVFDLDGWNIGIRYEPLGDDEDHFATAASTNCCWAYHEADITFNLDLLRTKDRDEIRRVVIHELLHCVCCGYQQYRRMEQLEAMVTTLTTATIRSWEAPAPRG